MNQQIDFFNRIKSVIPDYQNLAQTVAEVLEVSTNEAYKKIRGNSTLNLQQIVKLSDNFGVPFLYKPDQLPTVTFDYLSVDQEIPNMLLYLKDLLKNLQKIHQSKSKHITITTDDIPLFHFFKYPELTCFKLFYWSDSVMNTDTKFDPGIFTEEIINLAKELHQLYLEIPCTEIWAKDTVHGTIEQIRYAHEAGYISSPLAEQIIEQVRYCLTDMNMYAIASKKTIDPSHTFTWYNCDVLGSISYLIDFKDNMACYNRFNTFNYLRTEDQPYCLQTRKWMQGLIMKSVSFSGQGEKHRNKFLYHAFTECDNLIAEINQA
ncbi:helix-turn-helix domain-containing protein [Pedobacter sp.]|uniref:helix-turn-helix domain-containing protein n=1 Tax=Pedobacter sp. TaxID=1411316 RepID=UPI003BAB0AEE